MSGERASHLPALTGFRAVAALCVFLHHQPATVDWLLPAFAQRCVRELHIGVSLFFVLSGFLIQLRYSEAAGNGTLSIRQYFANRIARVWPLYLVVTLATFIAVWSVEGM